MKLTTMAMAAALAANAQAGSALSPANIPSRQHPRDGYAPAGGALGVHDKKVGNQAARERVSQ